MALSGAIDGDIRHAESTRARGPAFTQTTNEQGNKSFTGYQRPTSTPKPQANSTPGSQGIDAGLNQPSQQSPARPVTRINETVNAQGNRSFSGNTARPSGITAGLSPAVGGALTTETNRLKGQTQQPPVTATGALNVVRETGGIDSGLTSATGTTPINQAPARDKGSFAGNVLRSLHLDKIADLTPGYLQDAKQLANDGNYSQAAGRAVSGVAGPLILDAVDIPVGFTKTVGGGLLDFGKGLLGIENQPATTPDQKPSTAATGKKQPTTGAGVTEQPNTPEPDKSVIGEDGITRGLNDQGNRSFSGSNIAEFTPNDTTRTQDMSGPGKVVNAAFERAIAAGDYETALQMVNRSDASQMTRLGQLQGNIRSRREQELAASRAGGGIDQGLQQTAQKMLDRAEYLAQNNSSKAAARLSAEARALMGMGGGTGGRGGNVPVSPLTEGIDTAASLAQQQAQADTASMTAEQMRTAQQQQQELQGILQGLNDPTLQPQQRQSLLQRYQAIEGGKNYVETQSVVGYDREGSPLLATIKVDPVTGQTLGGIDSNMPTYGQALMAAQAKVEADPKSKPMVDAILMQQYGMGLPATK
ncbi:hypothetical protein ABIE61_001791 [Marinobacterium sp. MBR-111]|jgi:hypothetical protein|uniref:hypothetical protein n=1 Tax=Marinobacterium sp. MBR-111 TaxID=3156463 RepID=UPI003399C912